LSHIVDRHVLCADPTLGLPLTLDIYGAVVIVLAAISLIATLASIHPAS
jgi:hypothetical protein